MGTAQSRVEKYAKLTQDEQALIKNVWIGIENNPQFHGSVFFMGFCEIYPQYAKYFTADIEFPLTFDARTNAKFTVIMETMGYLLLDFHKKPKQLDYIIGYIAMIHKDMNLMRSDMLNFGNSLSKYLTATFPLAMTPESSKIISNYMNNLLVELSKKIEDFRKDDELGNNEYSDKMKIPCGLWLACGDNLIYGQTLDYWRERKIRWEKNLDDWRKIEESTTVKLMKNSSTEDEETSMPKSKTEDETSEFVESTARLLESHGIPRRKTSAIQELRGSREKLSIATSFTNLDKKNDVINDDMIIRKMPTSQRMTPRERRRNGMREMTKYPENQTRTTSLFPKAESKMSFPEINEFPEYGELQVSLRSQRMDSLARQKRRTTQAAFDLS